MRQQMRNKGMVSTRSVPSWSVAWKQALPKFKWPDPQR
jgi:hypothetical protein